MGVGVAGKKNRAKREGIPSANAQSLIFVLGLAAPPGDEFRDELNSFFSQSVSYSAALSALIADMEATRIFSKLLHTHTHTHRCA
jgi:hypothetical protein